MSNSAYPETRQEGLIRQTGPALRPQYLGVATALRDIYIPAPLPEEFVRLLARIK